MPTPQDATGDRPVRLVLADDLRRSRGTVFFRVVFALPFIIWLAVWGVAATCVAFVNWVATLFEGRSPAPLHDFLARFVRYATQIYAYLNLAAEPLPAFDGKPGYPVDVEIGPPARQNRWTVAFRAVLAIPAMALVAVLAGTGSFVFDYSRFSGGLGYSTAIGLAAVLRLVLRDVQGAYAARPARPDRLRALLRRAVLGLHAAGHRSLSVERSADRDRPAADPLRSGPDGGHR